MASLERQWLSELSAQAHLLRTAVQTAADAARALMEAECDGAPATLLAGRACRARTEAAVLRLTAMHAAERIESVVSEARAHDEHRACALCGGVGTVVIGGRPVTCARCTAPVATMETVAG